MGKGLALSTSSRALFKSSLLLFSWPRSLPGLDACFDSGMDAERERECEDCEFLLGTLDDWLIAGCLIELTRLKRAFPTEVFLRKGKDPC